MSYANITQHVTQILRESKFKVLCFTFSHQSSNFSVSVDKKKGEKFHDSVFNESLFHVHKTRLLSIVWLQNINFLLQAVSRFTQHSEWCRKKKFVITMTQRRKRNKKFAVSWLFYCTPHQGMSQNFTVLRAYPQNADESNSI